MADESVGGDLTKSDVDQAAETVAVATTEATWLQTRAILRVVFIVLAVAAALWLIHALEGVLLLVILAIFFAYLISPLVEFVRRPIKLRGRDRLMPRVLAIGIVYLMIFGSLGLSIYLLLPRLGNQISEFVNQAPTYLITARGRAQKLNSIYTRFQLPASARDAINNTVTSAAESVGEYATEVAKSIPSWLAYVPWLVLIPILAFFLLKDAEDFRRSALKMLPRGRIRWRGDEFFQDINLTLAAYIRATLIACVLIGTVCTIGFALIGVPYTLVLGIIAGLLEFIPLAGPLTVLILAAVVASFQSTGLVYAVIGFLLVLRVVHDYVIYPRIIGQGIHLHPLAVVLAILCGEELAGLAGVFLAIPVVAVISVTYRHWLEHRGSTGIVADLLKPVEQAVAPSTASSNETVPAAAAAAAPAATPALQATAPTTPAPVNPSPAITGR